MTRPPTHRQAGFALVESVAVLALSALVLVTLIIAADVVTRGANAAATRANALEALATGLAGVRRDLQAIRFVDVGGREEGRQAPLFVGEPQAVGLPIGGSGAEPGERLVWIAAEPPADGGGLVRSSAPLLATTRSISGVTFADPTTLIAGSWQYRFSYADQVGGAFLWRDSWRHRARLPAAIRLEVLSPSGERRVLPPLTVRVWINPIEDCPPGSEAERCEERGDGERGERNERDEDDEDERDD